MSERDDLNTVICGLEQPKRIWLFAYRHAGDVCWANEPNPEDAAEIEAVEYIRADRLVAMREALEEARTAMWPFIEEWAGVPEVTPCSSTGKALAAIAKIDAALTGKEGVETPPEYFSCCGRNKALGHHELCHRYPSPPGEMK